MSERGYKKALRAVARGLWSGVFTVDQFEDEMRIAINRFLNHAFDEGAEVFGVTPDEYTKEEFKAIGDIIKNEVSRISNLADFIVENSKENEGKLSKVFDRINLWVNRFNDMVDLAKVMVGKDQKLEWILGSTKSHCKTCLALAGKVKRASYWEKIGLRPKNPPNDKLECGGWECQCRLEPTKKPLSKGTLPMFRGLKYVNIIQRKGISYSYLSS